MEESGPPCGAALAGGPGLGALPGHTGHRTCETSRLRAALAGRARFKGPSQLTSPHQTGLTDHPRKEERSHKSDRKNLSFQKRSGKRVGTQAAAAGSSCRKGGGKPGSAGCVPLPLLKAGFLHFLGKTLQNHKKLDKIDSTHGTFVPEKGEKKWTCDGRNTHLRRQQKQPRQAEWLP